MLFIAYFKLCLLCLAFATVQCSFSSSVFFTSSCSLHSEKNIRKYFHRSYLQKSPLTHYFFQLIDYSLYQKILLLIYHQDSDSIVSYLDVKTGMNGFARASLAQINLIGCKECSFKCTDRRYLAAHSRIEHRQNTADDDDFVDKLVVFVNDTTVKTEQIMESLVERAQGLVEELIDFKVNLKLKLALQLLTLELLSQVRQHHRQVRLQRR